MAEQITDHVDQALARLTQQTRGKTQIEALVSALAEPAQDVETALWALLTERDINSAQGAQLDIIGNIVGQNRQGFDDDTFRRFIRARIVANRSHGLIEELLTIVRLVINDDNADITLEQQYPASVMIRLLNIVVDDDLARILLFDFLRDAIPGGVRIILEYAAIPDSEILYLDNDNLDEEKFIPAIA